MNVALRSVRTSLFVALGLTPACSRPSPNAPPAEGNVGGKEATTPASTATATAPPTDLTQAPTEAASDAGRTPSRTPAVGRCTNPKPVVVGGKETGFVACDEGHVHRVAVAACPSLLPRAAATCDPSYGIRGKPGCTKDADCKERPNGYCALGQIGCYCGYGCTKDSDCAKDEICQCGDPIGRCVAATCRTDASCKAGALCTNYEAAPGCPSTRFACQMEADECAGDRDCGEGRYCAITQEGGARTCSSMICAVGRPFLVAGAERLAGVSSRQNGWSHALVADVDASRLPPAERADKAAHWLQIARMEHASIAAFARFSLQLLALGAPPALVSESTAAMQDETEHAKIAFALASAYGGSPVGPSALPIDGALEVTSMAAVVRLVVREGCIGETLAAIAAREEASAEADATVALLLDRIAEDETRHAALAFRFVQWALREDVATTSRVLEEELSPYVARTLADECPRERPRGLTDTSSSRVRDAVVPLAVALLRDAGCALGALQVAQNAEKFMPADVETQVRFFTVSPPSGMVPLTA
jgi:hypothetical protein